MCVAKYKSMISPRILPALITFLYLSFFSRIAAAESTPPAADPFETHVRAGKASYQGRRYADALKEFEAALKTNPVDRDARLFAGISAYWNRQPDVALMYLNSLLDTTKRNSAEEWEIERNRLMAFAALGETEAAETVVDRLYELRQSKVPAALNAKWFTREHIFSGDQRIAAWEAFDERNESAQVWTFPVSLVAPVSIPTGVNGEKPAADSEPLVRRISVERVQLRGGAPGFALAEYGAGYRRVYNQWTQKPDYAHVRSMVLKIIAGGLAFIEESPRDNRAEFVASATEQPQQPAPAKIPAATPASPPTGSDVPADSGKRVLTEREQQTADQIAAMGYGKNVARMLTLVSQLREVSFDVTRTARLALTDPGLAERQLSDLHAAAPHAQEDAAELVDLLLKCSGAEAQEALFETAKMATRKPYLDFVLLTGINTRGKDFPEGLMLQCLKSSDAMVRQSAALMIARQGGVSGLRQLFEDLKNADAVGCQLINNAFQDLLGPALGAPAELGSEKSETLAKEWRERALKWWTDNEKNLVFSANPKTAGTTWQIK